MNDDHHWQEVTTRFPQFRVISASNFKEYRFYNYVPSAGKSGIWGLVDAVCIAFFSFVCYTVSACDSRRTLSAATCLVLLYGYWRCTAVVYESVIALPQCGIQLETHRGLQSIPLFVQRRFIPVTYMKDIIINEALRRWNVRYYLAALVHRPDGSYELAVAFENLQPRLPVLLEVFRDVRRQMHIE